MAAAVAIPALSIASRSGRRFDMIVILFIGGMRVNLRFSERSGRTAR